MASSSNVSLDQLSSDSLARVEKDPDLRATLAAIADRIHAQPDQASALALQDWEQWLDGEGYNTESLKAFIATLLKSEGIARSLSSIGREQNVSSLISVMEQELPDLLDLMLDTVDHSVKLHESLFGLAGGTARPPVRSSLKVQSKKQLASREAAAESGLSRDASSDSGNATVVGRDGAGEQKEYSRALDAVRGDLQRSKDGRVESRETRLGMMGATEDRRDVDRRADYEGGNGGGEQKDYSRAIDAARESLERRDTIVGPKGDQDRLSRVVDDLRSAIERRRTIEGPNGVQDRLSRAVDDVRQALDRRNTMVGPGGEQDDRLDKAVKDLRDALNPNPDARAEFRETQPGMMGATEDRRDVDLRGEPGYDGSGVQRVDVNARIDEARAELARGIERDPVRLAKMLDDLGPDIDRMVSDAERDRMIGANGLYRDPGARLRDAVMNVRSALSNEDGFVLEKAVKDLRDALNPNADARAEFRETQPGMMGATEDRPGIVRPGEPGYRGGGEQRVNPSVGEARPGIDHRGEPGYNGGGEQRMVYARIDKARDELSDSRLDAPRLKRVLNDLRAVKGMEEYLGRRTFDKLAEDLNRDIGGELDSRLKEAVNNVRDDLDRGRNLIREVERISDFDGRNGGGELKDYSRAIDRAMDELSERGIEVPRLKSVLNDLRAIKGVEDYVGRRTFDKLAEDLNSHVGGELGFRVKEAVSNVRDDLERARTLIREVELERFADVRRADIEGVNDGGEQKDYSRAIDKARDELSDSRLDVPRLKRVLNDLRAVKGMEEYLGRRTFDMLAEDLNRDIGGELDSRLKEAVNNVRVDLDRGRNLIREVERISDFDGRNGGGELKDYSRAIDRAMDELSERGIEVPRLKSVLNDLRAIKGVEDYVGRRTFDKLAEDLNSHVGGELDFRVKEAVSNVRDDLERARTLIREVELERFADVRRADMEGRNDGGEQKDYSRAIDKARDELSDSGLDARSLKRVMNDLRDIREFESRFPRMFDELENDLKNHSDDRLNDRLRTGVITLREELGRFRDPYPVMEKRVMIEDGVANDVDQFEQNKRGRTIDRVKEQLSDSGLDARSLRRIMNDLRDIREFKNQFPRAFDQLENDLDKRPDDQLDDSLRNDVSKLREELRWLVDPDPYAVG